MSVIALTTTDKADSLPSVQIVLADLVGTELRGCGGDLLFRMDFGD